jgi:hypothetical protein
MKTDTQIRHVTKPLELGLSPAEAERLQAASRKQIDDARQRMAQSPIANAE